MSAKLGSLSILLEYNWDHEYCPLNRVVGCPLFRGCLSIEVNGRAVGTSRIVRYIVGVHYSGVSVKWGSIVVTSVFPSPGLASKHQPVPLLQDRQFHSIQACGGEYSRISASSEKKMNGIVHYIMWEWLPITCLSN